MTSTKGRSSGGAITMALTYPRQLFNPAKKEGTLIDKLNKEINLNRKPARGMPRAGTKVLQYPVKVKVKATLIKSHHQTTFLNFWRRLCNQLKLLLF